MLRRLVGSLHADIRIHTAILLRGAFDEIDFVQLLRLLLAAQRPHRAIAPYAEAWYDPHFVPLIVLQLIEPAAPVQPQPRSGLACSYTQVCARVQFAWTDPGATARPWRASRALRVR